MLPSPCKGKGEGEGQQMAKLTQILDPVINYGEITGDVVGLLFYEKESLE